MTTASKWRVLLGYAIVVAIAAFLSESYDTVSKIYTVLILLPILYPLLLIVRLAKAVCEKNLERQAKPTNLDFTNRGK